MQTLVLNEKSSFEAVSAYTKHYKIFWLLHDQLSMKLQFCLFVFIQPRNFNKFLDCGVTEFVLLKASYRPHAEISNVFHCSENIRLEFPFYLFNQVENCTQHTTLIGSISEIQIKWSRFLFNSYKRHLNLKWNTCNELQQCTLFHWWVL